MGKKKKGKEADGKRRRSSLKEELRTMEKNSETAIPQEEISLEELQGLDIGGNSIQNLYAEDFTQPLKYVVKSAKGIKTKWGIRVDFVMADNFAEWRVSSWNMIFKDQLKPLDLIGKTVQLKQNLSSVKKFDVTILD